MSGEKCIRAAFYHADSGTEPARDWLLDMTEEDGRTTGYDIGPGEFGWPVSMPICRAMGQAL